MPAKFIRDREEHEAVEYHRLFIRRDQVGCGYSFPCDEQGNVRPDMSDAARENLRKCLSGEVDVIDRGVERYVRRWVEPAAIECVRCGTEVVLWSAWASACEKCGAEYNGAGQQLAPREQWGEETGEHYADLHSEHLDP